jgi:hypothetical protein
LPRPALRKIRTRLFRLGEFTFAARGCRNAHGGCSFVALAQARGRLHVARAILNPDTQAGVKSGVIDIVEGFGRKSMKKENSEKIGVF